MAKTASGLVDYVQQMVGLPYWWGTFGQVASASLYQSKKQQYPSYYTATDFASQYGKRVHDCAGLIKGYLWSDTPTSTPVYNAAQDITAQGFYSNSSNKGLISTFPKRDGLLLFSGSSTSNITHVAIYAGGYVYEARNHASGVTKSSYTSSRWIAWAESPFIDYSGDGNANTNTSQNTSGNAGAVTSKTATRGAEKFNRELTGTYKVTAQSGLNIRNGAGTNYSVMVAIPYGTKVQMYGYYTCVSGIPWYYIEVEYNGVLYTGHASAAYLVRT